MRNLFCLGRVWQISVAVSILALFAQFVLAESLTQQETQSDTAIQSQEPFPTEDAGGSIVSGNTPENADENLPSTGSNPTNPDSPSETNNLPPDTSDVPVDDTLPNTDLPETEPNNALASNEINITPNETIPNETNNSLSTVEIAQPLSIDIAFPEKVTRGEILEIIASIANTGSSDVNNIVIIWHLPEGFEKSQGTYSTTEGSEKISEQADCSFLAPLSSCQSRLSVKTSLSASLGLSEIKAVVRYG